MLKSLFEPDTYTPLSLTVSFVLFIVAPIVWIFYYSSFDNTSFLLGFVMSIGAGYFGRWMWRPTDNKSPDSQDVPPF